MFMFSCVQVCGCWSWCQVSSLIFILRFLYWGRVSHLKLELADLTSPAGQLALGIPHFYLWSFGIIRELSHHVAFYVGDRGLNSLPFSLLSFPFSLNTPCLTTIRPFPGVPDALSKGCQAASQVPLLLALAALNTLWCCEETTKQP